MTYKFLAVTLLVVLQACGGGGGGDAPPTTPLATYDLNAMQTALVTSTNSFTGSATNATDAYQMFLSITPAADASFEGTTRKRATQTLTLRKNGATLTATTFDGFYAIGPFQAVGAIYAGGGYLVATTPHPPLPTAALVGAGGSLGTQTLYQDSTKGTILATQQGTWTLESSTSGSANYCANTVLSNTSSVVIGTSVGCFRIIPNGSIQGIRWTISVDGLTLTFQ